MSISTHGLDCAIEGSLIDLSEVFNVLNRLLQVGHLVDMHGKESVQRNLPVDISLTLHETARVGLRTTKAFLNQLLFFLVRFGFFLRQVLRQVLIADFQRELTDDAVSSLTV